MTTTDSSSFAALDRQRHYRQRLQDAPHRALPGRLARFINAWMDDTDSHRGRRRALRRIKRAIVQTGLVYPDEVRPGHITRIASAILATDEALAAYSRVNDALAAEKAHSQGMHR